MPRPRLRAVLVSLGLGCAPLVAASSATAAPVCTTTFTAAVDRHWGSAANWDHGIPTATSVACVNRLDSSGYPDVTVVGSAVAGAIEGTGRVAVDSEDVTPAVLDLGRDTSATQSNLGILSIESGRVHLHGAAQLTTGSISGSTSWSSALDLGTGGASVATSSVSSPVILGQGTVTVSSDGEQGSGRVSGGVSLGSGITLVATAGGNVYLNPTTLSPEGTVVTGGTLEGTTGGSLQVNSNGAHVTATADVALSLGTSTIPAGNPTIAADTDLSGDITGDLRFTGAVHVGGIAHITTGSTVTADSTVSLATGFGGASTLTVDGALDGSGSLSGDLQSTLAGTGSIGLPISTTGEVRGPSTLGPSLTIGDGGGLRRSWDDPVMTVGTASIGGHWFIDGPDGTPVGSTEPFLTTTGALSFTATINPAVNPHHDRSYEAEVTPSGVITRVHDARLTLTVLRSVADGGDVDLTVAVTPAPGEAEPTGDLAWSADKGYTWAPFESTLSNGVTVQPLHVPSSDTSIRLIYNGDPHHEFTVSDITVAPDAPTVTAVLPSTPVTVVAPPTPKALHVGAKVTSGHARRVVVKVTAGAAGAHNVVLLQVLRKGRWVTLTRALLSGSGQATLASKAVGKGSVRLRIVVPATASTLLSSTATKVRIS